MNVMLVDEKQSELRQLTKIIQKFYPCVDVISCSNPQKALEYIENQEIDVCFTEVRMKKVSGFYIAEKLKERQKFTQVIFMADTDEYAMEARERYVNGYLLRPITEAAVDNILKEK